jgi:hypothetical protein
MTEAQLDRLVFDYARWRKVYAYHTRDSRGSARGFPDWVLVGPGGILYRENKTASGRVTVDQRAWGMALVAAGGNWSVWREADWHAGRIRREIDQIANVPEDQAARDELVAAVAILLATHLGDQAAAAEVAELVVGMVLAARGALE